MKNQSFSILLKTVLFSIALLCLGLLSASIAAYFLSSIFPNGAITIVIILNLFILWLVNGSTIRSIYRLDSSVNFLELVFAGILTVLGGILIFKFLRGLVQHFSEINLPYPTAETFQQEWLFIIGLAVFLSLFSAVNIKVKSRFLGNLIEFILVVGTIILLLNLAGKF